MLQATSGTGQVLYTTLWCYRLFIPVWLMMVVLGEYLHRVQQHAVKTARQKNVAFHQSVQNPTSGSGPVLPTIPRGRPNCATKV
jgi:hypothetical protein